MSKSKTPPRRAWAEISSTALLHNFTRVQQYCDESVEIMPVVKANAYGHGLAQVVKTLAPCASSFAVASLSEAQALRALAPEHAIVCLSGFYRLEQIKVLRALNISPVIYNASQIGLLEAQGGLDLPVYLKVDTGMGRLGVAPAALSSCLKRLEAITSEVRLMSHFASADTPESKQNERQHACFKTSGSKYNLKQSFANSAAIITRKQDHYDMVRPGIMLYGSSPMQTKSAQQLGLKPVMRVYARLLDIKQITAGDTTGYGGKWQASQNSRIGIVGFGYADGYPRVLSVAAEVGLAGQRCKIIGQISMDSMAIDLGGLANATIGDKVELWGDAISVDEVATWANTIGYEILCGLGSRVFKHVLPI